MNPYGIFCFSIYHPCITYIKCFLTTPVPSVDTINSTCYVLDIDWALPKNTLNLETGQDQTALLS